MSVFKVFVNNLADGARAEIAAILDEHVEAMTEIIDARENIPGLLAACTSRTQAQMLAAELRSAGGGEDEAAGLRAEIKRLRREVDVLTIEKNELRARVVQ